MSNNNPIEKAQGGILGFFFIPNQRMDGFAVQGGKPLVPKQLFLQKNVGFIPLTLLRSFC